MINAKDMKESLIVICTKKEEIVSKVIGRLKKNNASEVYIEELQGNLSHFLLLNSRPSANKTKIKQFIIPVSKVNLDDNLIVITQKFIDSNSIILPVFDKDNLIKFVDVYELFNLLKDNPKLKLKINDIVDRLVTIKQSATLGEVIHFMNINKVREVYVENKGEIIGTISTINLLKNFILKHITERQHGEVPNTPIKTHQTELKDIKKLSIENFIEPNINKIKKDAKFNEVLKLFSKTKSYNLLVKNSSNKNIGIINLKQTLKSIIEIFKIKQSNIFYKGLKELNLDETMTKNIQNTVENYAEKLQYYFKNIFKINIHIKEHQKEGNKSRFQVFSKLSYPGAIITSEDDDWEIMIAIRKSFEKLKNQLESKYKNK
ncbi:MAG: CBS domain-containing protein [Candidatus Woesearchaeota archaeon]